MPEDVFLKPTKQNGEYPEMEPPDEPSSVEHEPKYWFTEKEARIWLRIPLILLRKYAEARRADNPDWIKPAGDSHILALPLLEKIAHDAAMKMPQLRNSYYTNNRLATEMSTNDRVIKRFANRYRDEHPDWFVKFDTSLEHYAPPLVRILKREIKGYLEKRPEAKPGWKDDRTLAGELNVGVEIIQATAEQYRTQNPKWFKEMLTERNQMKEHYGPNLVTEIERDVKSRSKFRYGWQGKKSLARELGISVASIEGRIGEDRRKHPGWFNTMPDERGKMDEHLAPQLVGRIRRKLRDDDLERERRNLSTGESHESPAQKPKNSTGLTNFVKEVARGETMEAHEFGKLLSIFGSANVIDILYRFHPHYRRSPMGEVRSIISEYLGDFLHEGKGFNIENISETGLAFLENVTFQDYLFEALKRDVLASYNQERRAVGRLNPVGSVGTYLENLKAKAKKLNNANLDLVIERLAVYYGLIFGARKPDAIVSALGTDRPFPDFYQAINIKEASDKKKLLIADEMGVGKSASAILTKEYLGLSQALVIVPSNVIDTWRGYLSDEKEDGGKQVGYFNEGQAPSVLVVESIDDLKAKDTSRYDYILVSQEKLGEKYTAELLARDFQMLIVDEVHKLKNVKEGVRARNLLKLAGKIQGEDRYLALLSGTPVPNKVRDVAIVLKLLYPDEYGDMNDKKLTHQIIYSDVLDLRSKLLQRMEMKSLGENIDMPNLTEEVVGVELSGVEKDIYELLLDEDELEATDKIRILRQFLLNPELLDATPGIPCAKISRAGEALRNAFETKDKVVMFVNGYVEGVIRGDKNIITNLGIPNGVEVLVIHGDVSREERRRIQGELSEAGRKILLLVSGQTADVGVDFSPCDAVYFYNEPWTMAEEKQQLGRVYRPGLAHDLQSTIFVTRNTIEEGIRLYIQTKQRAIEKLMKGLPRTDIENRLLEEDEKQSEPNLEVNPELARYYFSDWDKMMKIFAFVKEIGEKKFTDFLSQFGQEYARCYLGLGSRSYQANASRISATLIERFVEEDAKESRGVVILDLASGPEMLKKHSLPQYQDRIVSMDINREHFKHAGEKRVIGSFLNIPLRSGSVDYLNLNFALHYTQFVPSRGKFERLEALAELNRVLKVGGRGIINMIYSLEYRSEEKFRHVLNSLGFEIDEENSGKIEVGKNYSSHFIVIRKVTDLLPPKSGGDNVEELLRIVGNENLEGLKFVENRQSLKDSRKIVRSFKLNNSEREVVFNSVDTNVYAEEQEIEGTGKALKTQYEGIENIPKPKIIERGFTRILLKDRYLLFKKLKGGGGVVVVK
jgi:superfamily II DNA or RNA helicase/SAM-dependent methyltransferase